MDVHRMRRVHRASWPRTSSRVSEGWEGVEKTDADRCRSRCIAIHAASASDLWLGPKPVDQQARTRLREPGRGSGPTGPAGSAGGAQRRLCRRRIPRLGKQPQRRGPFIPTTLPLACRRATPLSTAERMMTRPKHFRSGAGPKRFHQEAEGQETLRTRRRNGFGCRSRRKAWHGSRSQCA